MPLTNNVSVSEDCSTAQSLLSLEFKVTKDSEDRLIAIRQVNQSLQERNFKFKLLGHIHGKKVGNQSFEFGVRGSEILTAMFQRTNEIKGEMARIGGTLRDSHHLTLTAIV